MNVSLGEVAAQYDSDLAKVGFWPLAPLSIRVGSVNSPQVHSGCVNLLIADIHLSGIVYAMLRRRMTAMSPFQTIAQLRSRDAMQIYWAHHCQLQTTLTLSMHLRATLLYWADSAVFVWVGLQHICFLDA